MENIARKKERSPPEKLRILKAHLRASTQKPKTNFNPWRKTDEYYKRYDY